MFKHCINILFVPLALFDGYHFNFTSLLPFGRIQIRSAFAKKVLIFWLENLCLPFLIKISRFLFFLVLPLRSNYRPIIIYIPDTKQSLNFWFTFSSPHFLKFPAVFPLLLTGFNADREPTTDDGVSLWPHPQTNQTPHSKELYNFQLIFQKCKYKLELVRIQFQLNLS